MVKIDKESFGKFFDGTPGKTWDDYASRLKNAGAGEVDDRGYSLADEFEGSAEGGPTGPAMPAPGADLSVFAYALTTASSPGVNKCAARAETPFHRTALHAS